jgi:hypothetical protein
MPDALFYAALAVSIVYALAFVVCAWAQAQTFKDI